MLIAKICRWYCVFQVCMPTEREKYGSFSVFSVFKHCVRDATVIQILVLPLMCHFFVVQSLPA